MDLLNKINNCSNSEIDYIIEKELNEIINTSEKNKRLGFMDNSVITSKIPAHKGFISPDSKIKYCNISAYMYSMCTSDYFYEFAKYIKEKNVVSTGAFVKTIQNFIHNYFGKANSIDMRSAYFDKIALETTTTDDEFFEKIDSLQIGDLKGKNIAMCTENAALAQNLLSLFGFEVYYCIGCAEHSNKEEAHCFNIAKAKNGYILLDYSIPVSVFSNNEAIDYVPFQGFIGFDEINDVLINGVNKTFDDYEYVMTSTGIKKMPTGETRTYVVGKLELEKLQEHKR